VIQATVEQPRTHRRALVNASRLALAMLAIAAVALLVLGAASLLLADPPDVDGWLRAIFGQVFGVVALALAATLGIPSGVGLLAMAGSTRPEAEPAMPSQVRTAALVVASATTALTAVVLVMTGSSVTLLNLALVALVAMSLLGLAGAVSFSPHRGRAVCAAIALVAVAIGAMWVLNAAFLARPA